MSSSQLSFQTINFSPLHGSTWRLETLIEACASAGYEQIGLDVFNAREFVNRGGNLRNLSRMLSEAHLQCTDIMALVVTENLQELRTETEELCRLGEETGAAVCGLATYVPIEGDDSIRQLSWSLDRLARSGLRAALEFLPYSPINSLEGARSIANRFGRERCGLMIDSWHMYATGTATTDLLTLTADEITIVQFSDAVPIGSDVVFASRNLRRLPGDGEIDLAGIVAALRTVGYSGVVSPEVLSKEARRRPPIELARRTRELLEYYWAEPTS